MTRYVSAGIFFLLLYSNAAFPQTKMERQKKYLQDALTFNIEQRFQPNTRRISVQDSTWADWLKRTGELPPDFETMPSVPMLPEPLVLTRNGKDHPITTKAQWQEKREWIKKEYRQWISGHAPPPPKDIKVEILSERTEYRSKVQLLQLSFGPAYKGIMTVELMIPEGKGPFPVYLTQWTHREWALLAVKRGYIGCVYAASDIKDDTDLYQFLYPDYDFTLLMRRAWGASRVVDYLLTRKEVKADQIAITGHSRNGKQSLWAAAFDERIGAVISSSSSTGGDAPWRFGDPQYASETIDYVGALQGHWFHPRLRFFFGHEDKLPVDQNLLGAVIAPRPLLYHYSTVERGLNSWANEQNYYSVKKVYDFFNASDKIGVLTRMGEHAVAARDVEKTIDFLNIHFKKAPQKWNNVLLYPYQYRDWEQHNAPARTEAAHIKPVVLRDSYKDTNAFNRHRQQITTNLAWLLGEAPPGVKAVDAGSWNSPKADWITNIVPRPVVKGAKMIHLSPYSSIGEHIDGVLYCPADKKGNPAKFPVIIYSHQYAYSTGFSKGYDKNGRNGTADLFAELVSRGFAVLAIDLFGFGTRIEEATQFYQRHPHWSKMGKMVRDLQSCMDAVEDLDYLDESRIYLLGNTIGGSLSLITAALDQRVAGVATVAAFSPWRTSNKQYESLRTYAHLHGFIPRLGFFAENPGNAPVDFGEILAAVAPKPVLLIAPDADRYTDIKALQKVVGQVSDVYGLYGQKNSLQVKYPHEINRMTREMYSEVGEFFTQLAGRYIQTDR
ncbi:alpha/beta fold hydrolase [Chitinophaga alhagiae]|uniref:alpha/beta fold hydrolase n=1 Tax=Chitinophaga alhagiae TaxID=2203219 RepID=UPI000E5A968B|nr:alpha/beta fold hydrolase [Chitinophaga alhagiae]